ncbi:MAG: hypothetical protein ACRD0N_13900 [Acidimicrobiales bacterium]
MLRRPLPACAVLLGAYLLLSLFNDPRAYLGTDTGGKVATLEVMEERGRLDPDIGYWAEQWDPEGRVHPLYYTKHVNHRWVNVTTVPMLYASYPLYRLGGYRAVLVLPMIGSVLAALAARALARRLSDGEGWAAFWLVGLASPVTVYALDFWEHSLGLAAVAWALVLLVDLVQQRRSRWWWPLAAGALFGLAATLRNEAFVYGFVAVGLACLVVLLVQRKPALAVVTGLLAAAGLAVPVLANAALERATIGDPIRVERAADTASASGGISGTRLEEAKLNSVSLSPLQQTSSYVRGVLVLALLVFLALRASRPGDTGPAVIAAGGIVVLYLDRFDLGFGFIPSLLGAAPLVAVGLALGWGPTGGRYLLGVSLLALPLVWATQFQGGAAPQWGARYLLVSGLAMAVLGAVNLVTLASWARAFLVGLTVVVTGFGLIWTSQRTHGVADALAALNARTEPVLVSRIGHLAREGGAFYTEHRWLTAPSDEDEAFAVDVLERAGVDRYALVALGTGTAPPPPDGWRVVGRDTVDYLGFDLRVTSFARRTSP